MHGLSRTQQTSKVGRLLNFSNVFYRSIIRTSLLSFWELVCRFPACVETDITTFAVWNVALKWVNRQTAECISYLKGESWPLECDTEEKHWFHTCLPASSWEAAVLQCRDKGTVLGGKQLSI